MVDNCELKDQFSIVPREQYSGATFIFKSTNLNGPIIPCSKSSNNDGCRYVLPPGETVLKHICWLFHFDFMKYRPRQFIECLTCPLLFCFASFYVFSFVLIFFLFLFISKRLDGYKREVKRHLKSVREIVSEWQGKCFFFIFLIQEMIRCIFQVSYTSKRLKKIRCYLFRLFCALLSDLDVMAFCCRTGRK